MVLLLLIVVPALALLAAACLVGRRPSGSADAAGLAAARSGKLAADLAHISSQGGSQGAGQGGLRSGPMA